MSKNINSDSKKQPLLNNEDLLSVDSKRLNESFSVFPSKRSFLLSGDVNINGEDDDAYENNNDNIYNIRKNLNKSFFPLKLKDFFLNSETDDDEIQAADDEDPEYESMKKKSIIKNILQLKKTNEWNEYLETYRKNVREKHSIIHRIKTVFNINSDLIIIWKNIYSAFTICIVFLFLFKYIFITLGESDSDYVIEKRYIFVYNIINFVFVIDFVFSLITLIFNGGSKMTIIKFPLKIYNIIPFPLSKKYIYFILPKFFRVDLFEKLFKSSETFINVNIAHYIQNYYLKIFVTYTTNMFKYLIIFYLYAHCTSCLLAYFNDLKYYSSLYYTIEAFTGIGFGEQKLKTIQSILIVILDLFIGVNLFSIIIANINYLSDKLYSFNRETSFNENFEFLLFRIQKSIGKIFPIHLKQLMTSFLLFRRGLTYIDIKQEHKYLLVNCKKSVIDEIHMKLFNFLRNLYKNYFLDEDFMNAVFENMKPKILKKNKLIIESGEKVNKLFFLLSGDVFAYDSKENPIFVINDGFIIGDYEFLTGTLSIFNYRVHPKKPAYGFTIDKNEWDDIAKKYVKSMKYFVEQSNKKRVKHIEWLRNRKIKSGIELFEKKPEKINNDKNNNLRLSVRKLELIKPVTKKNEMYMDRNIEVIKNIDEFYRDMNIMEVNFFNAKRKILNQII